MPPLSSVSSLPDVKPDFENQVDFVVVEPDFEPDCYSKKNSSDSSIPDCKYSDMAIATCYNFLQTEPTLH